MLKFWLGEAKMMSEMKLRYICFEKTALVGNFMKLDLMMKKEIWCCCNYAL